MGYRYRSLSFEVATTWLELVEKDKGEGKINLPDRSDFALYFIPDLGDAGHQWDSHNPLDTVLELDEVADIETPVRMISKHPAGLGRIVLRG
jgi:hypothetical protein